MKILFLQKHLLFPPDTGWRLRTLNVLRHLARWHEVTYVCNLEEAEGPHLDEMRGLGCRVVTVPWRDVSRNPLRFCLGLAGNLLSRYPYTVSKNYDPRLRKRAAELLAAEPYDVLICDFVQIARHAVGLPVKCKVLFQHNVEAQILRRHATHDRGLLRRAYMAHQWRKMRTFEARAGRQFDAVIAVSEADRATFVEEYGWQHVSAIDTGVDVDYFRPNGFAEQADRVVFVGSLDWLPNQDGARHFVERVWPLVRRCHPQARFQIVGRHPTQAVMRLGRAAGVEVVGTVPDVRPYLSAAAVVVVPLLVGGGTRIKIVEAMAMGKAVVSTTLGAEGLNVSPTEHIVLADAAADFSLAVSRLLATPAVRKRLGESARAWVCRHFAAETVARQFERICADTLATKS